VKIGCDPDKHLRIITDYLNSEQMEEILEAIKIVRKMGPDAQDVLPILRDIEENSSPGISSAASQAVGEIENSVD